MKETAVAVGKFDGLHLGHRKVIAALTKYSAQTGAKPLVVTFDPSPSVYFGQSESVIYTPSEREYILKGLGIDSFLRCPFGKEIAETDAESFAQSFLFGRLNAKAVFAGQDFRFGKARLGDFELLRRLGAERGIEVFEIGAAVAGNTRISSTAVREVISGEAADMELVAQMLDEPLFLIDKVSEGKKNGRRLGFPTINIHPSKRKLLPRDGVYKTVTEVFGNTHNSITNIGTNPTFSGNERVVETHILGLDSDLYGENVKVSFLKFLRAEIKFSNEAELIAQIASDIKACSYPSE